MTIKNLTEVSISRNHTQLNQVKQKRSSLKLREVLPGGIIRTLHCTINLNTTEEPIMRRQIASQRANI